MDTRPDDEDLLTIPEAAAMARMKVNAFKYKRNRGEGPDGFHLGKRVVFRKGKVRQWIAEIEAAQAGQGAA